MSRPDLKILGLGRCIIGNLNKSLQANAAVQLERFDHRYFLNYSSLLDSSEISQQQLEMLEHCNIAPTFQQQLQLPDADNVGYNLILVELFPPAPLYVHTGLGLYCSVEDANATFMQQGFIADSASQDALQRNAGLPQVLKRLIERLRQQYLHTPLVFVNGEYYSAQENIGNSQLDALLKSVATVIEAHDNCRMLNMKALIDMLSLKKLAFADTEFPMAYIRHTPSLTPIAIAIDCKHASHQLRDLFAVYLLMALNILPETEYVAECEQTFDSRPADFEARAREFLMQADNIDLDDPRQLARCFLYARAYPDVLPEGWLRMQIIEHLEKPLAADLLKRGIFFIRSIAAWQYENADSVVFQSLLDTLLEIGQLPENVQQDMIRPLILWIKNIVLALNHNIAEVAVSTILLKRYIEIIDLLSRQSVLQQSALIYSSIATARAVAGNSLSPEKRAYEN